ncbi:nuclear matrix protein [Aureobasidium pullulans]|uniref:Nuclear matrix protein n=1 Tax=Aureobasidium pullulans TaxID=5580 RepID=A0A4S9L4N6_AURPU|nr:nuclear matrix protein [Aureobasidium pullulans]
MSVTAMAADAMTEPQSVGIVSARLRALLQRAREIKSVETIDPPLPVSDLAQEVSALGKNVFQSQPDAHKFSVVETAARKIFYETIQSTDIKTPGFVRMWDFLDLLLLCGELGQCEPILPFWLVEELLDSQTTEGCRTIFDYLESRRERLIQKDFHKTHLALLRSCNELLRRLSRAEDAVFCGRVFFFLFQTFPLGDKSSVNLRGEYHTENVTVFEKDPPADVEAPEPMDVVMEMEPDAESKSKDVKDTASTKDQAKISMDKKGEDVKNENSEFYPIFWRLQHDFSNPIRLFEDENFSPFKDGIEKTLTKFKKTPVVAQTKSAGDAQRGIKRKLGDDNGDQYASNYNPKYLTSRELFELELSDLAFQRHILVQGLILIDFLLSLTEKAKKKWAEVEKTSSKSANRGLLYGFTLSEDNEKWVISTRSRIAGYLQEGPEGKFYYRMVDTVLSRDKNWVRWKLESCPQIVKEAVTPEENTEAKSGARQATVNKRLKAKPMGAIDVTFLAEVDNAKGLEALKDASRFTAPAPEKLVKGIESDDLDLEMAMTDDEMYSLEAAKQSKTWRALRAASRTSLALLDKVDPSTRLPALFKQEENQEESAAHDPSASAPENDSGEVAVATDGKAEEQEVAE